MGFDIHSAQDHLVGGSTATLLVKIRRLQLSNSGNAMAVPVS